MTHVSQSKRSLWRSVVAPIAACFLVSAAIAVPGMPVKLISLLFCYTLGLMGIISPYATGPGPIYYGSGYVSRKDFWTLGFVFGAIYLAALLVIGVPYLRHLLA